MTTRENIVAAMSAIEGIPCGGVGEDGPTLDELNEYVEEHGQPWESNADYHAAQLAWRYCEAALRTLEEA